MVQVASLRQRLLGAHVAERAQQVAGDRQAGVILEPGQAEIRDPEVALDVQQQVGRLDVAVHDAELVRVVERLGRLDAQRGGRSEVLAAAGGRGGAGRVALARGVVWRLETCGRGFGGAIPPHLAFGHLPPGGEG